MTQICFALPCQPTESRVLCGSVDLAYGRFVCGTESRLICPVSWPLDPLSRQRLLEDMAADYMETEYGLTREEADRAVARIKAETQSAKAKGALLSLDELEASLPQATRRRRKKLQSRAGKARA